MLHQVMLFHVSHAFLSSSPEKQLNLLCLMKACHLCALKTYITHLFQNSYKYSVCMHIVLKQLRENKSCPSDFAADLN